MSKKYYVIWKGEKTGIFDSWPQVKELIDGRSDAQYMGFSSKELAQAAFKESYTRALMKRSLEKEGKSKPPASTPNSSQKATRATSSDIAIYSDGACSPNPGQAGTGLAVYNKNQLEQLLFGLYESQGTNNSAELYGLLEALKLAQTYLEKGLSVQVLSDSKYSIDCITKWATGWKNKGWTRGKGEPIKNLETIKQAYSLYQELKTHITITHVKGHANIEGNELADRMAVYARMTKQTRLIAYQETMDINTILAMPSG
ncbi:ribonuclease H family protein [Psychrobium sp. 1_MG-2023]|uniref:ribonuclease H family protein n=1 Tax=Psychrobium sp. 1_MG-2023 TaxID=3062624 RepID=UPI000C323E44|nr:ribonuclease H family protein [Psychrobium sp. 1_MG-2023]MDP2562713.1 ribonuclease H family protein [Psychrobium sp. 1_MG-2023]PKF54024.1 ribonuclease HI [Alteromonadales bacterium alter-6D02]